MPLSATILRDLVAALHEKVAELADVFAVQLPSGLDFNDILAAAQRQLSEVASEAAGDLLRMRPDSAEMALWQEAQETQRAMRAFLQQTDKEARQSSESHTTNASTRSGSAAELLRPAKVQTRECSKELLQRLTAAVAACRQQHCALTLALVELDGFEAIAQAAGPLAAEQLIARLQRVCQEFGGSVVSHSQAEQALIWANCDRSQATRMANELLRRAVHDLTKHHDETLGPIAISIGVATVALPSKNFPPLELAESASRCLSSAQLSGGNTVKSIGVY
jgi:GGDEF domain-containing protein